MNEEEVERYSSISIRPYRPELWAAFPKTGDLTPDERRERRLRSIDEAEHEIRLIRGELGKLPEFSLDKRIDDLLSIWRIRLKIGDGESTGSTREERLNYVEQLIKQHRIDLNMMDFPDSAKPAEEPIRNAPCLWLLLLAGVWCTVLALADFREIWIYDLSRWALFCIGAYVGFRFWKDGARRLPIVLGIMAVVFNPFAPIRFGDAWRVVDALAGATFLGVCLWVSALRVSRMQSRIRTEKEILIIQKNDLKPAAWKQILGGVFVILAFFAGAAVVAVVRDLIVLSGRQDTIILIVPWIFGCAAYWVVKRRLSKN